MIELGEGAYPVLFDADADGKKDLIVGNLGYYTVNTNKSKLAYYRNIGTNTSPSFSLITRDYQFLSSYNIFSMAPTFGDLDGDGDKDLIVGATNGKVHFLKILLEQVIPPFLETMWPIIKIYWGVILCIHNCLM